MLKSYMSAVSQLHNAPQVRYVISQSVPLCILVFQCGNESKPLGLSFRNRLAQGIAVIS